MNMFEFLGMMLIIGAFVIEDFSQTESVISAILGIICCVWLGEMGKVYRKEAGK